MSYAAVIVTVYTHAILLHKSLGVQVDEVQIASVLLGILCQGNEGLLDQVTQSLAQLVHLRLMLAHCFQEGCGRPEQLVQDVLWGRAGERGRE